MTACDPSVWGARAVRAPRPYKPYGPAGVPARRPFVSPGTETMEFGSKAAPARRFSTNLPL
jgi:hypothetical protein